MRLRMYAATVTGTLALLLVAMGTFSFTDMTVDKILFWAVMAYAFGVGAVLWLTEPKVEIRETGGDFKVFDLKAGTEFTEKRQRR